MASPVGDADDAGAGRDARVVAVGRGAVAGRGRRRRACRGRCVVSVVQRSGTRRSGGRRCRVEAMPSIPTTFTFWTTRCARSGCSPSTPLSTTATVCAAAVEARGVGRAARRSAPPKSEVDGLVEVRTRRRSFCALPTTPRTSARRGSGGASPRDRGEGQRAAAARCADRAPRGAPAARRARSAARSKRTMRSAAAARARRRAGERRAASSGSEAARGHGLATQRTARIVRTARVTANVRYGSARIAGR